ncbi:YitT family protein [Paenibacillus profundus]|uniref:YitT family protein n=1 Tax=Paenibacillus profundus TaxID=1173085 RepID=A0ABS8YE44_9BACL|nr:YitT family protein [Paenibacillus profundus]
MPIAELIKVRYVHKAIAILLGSLLIAAGIQFFLVPFKVLDGGIVGISLILNYLFGTKVGLVIIGCSIPIFAVAWVYRRELFYNSLHGMFISSFIIDLFEPLQYHFLYYVNLSPPMSSTIGGLIIGTGIGIMLRFETSTGGTDLLAKHISNVLNINAGFIIFIMDAIVIGIGGLLISTETLLLSLIAISSGGIMTSLCVSKGKT